MCGKHAAPRVRSHTNCFAVMFSDLFSRLELVVIPYPWNEY